MNGKPIELALKKKISIMNMVEQLADKANLKEYRIRSFTDANTGQTYVHCCASITSRPPPEGTYFRLDYDLNHCNGAQEYEEITNVKLSGTKATPELISQVKDALGG